MSDAAAPDDDWKDVDDWADVPEAASTPKAAPGVWDAVKGIGRAAAGEISGDNGAETELRSALGGFSNAIGLNAGKLVDKLEGAFPVLKKTPEELISGAPASNLTPNKQAFVEAQQKAPLANMAGAVAAPNPLGKVGVLGKGVGGLGGVAVRAGARGLEGAGLAGLYGYGASDKEGLERLKDAGHSAEWGGGLGVGTSLAGQVASQLGQRLTNRTAPGLALKSVTHGRINDKLADMGYSSQADRDALGRAMLDEGIVGFGKSASGSQDAAGRVKELAGQQAGAILKQADQAGKFNPLRAAQVAERSYKGAGLSPAAADASGKAQQAVDQISRVEPSFQKARELKSDLYDAVNWNDEAKLAQALHRKATLGLRDSIESQVGEALGPEAAAKMKAANQRFGMAADASSLAADEASREAQRNPMGHLLTAIGATAGIGGMASGHTAGGIEAAAVPLLLAAIRGRTASSAASAANRAGQFINWAGRKADNVSVPGGTSRAGEALREAINAYLENKSQEKP